MKTLLVTLFMVVASLAAHAGDQPKPVFLVTNCSLKSGSMILSAFKEALQSSKKYELVPNLSDNGKNDVVIELRMICEEDKGDVAVASVLGFAKCFGPKNGHVSVNGSTLTALSSEPGIETQSGTNLFKGFEDTLEAIKDQMVVLQ